MNDYYNVKKTIIGVAIGVVLGLISGVLVNAYMNSCFFMTRGAWYIDFKDGEYWFDVCAITVYILPILIAAAVSGKMTWEEGLAKGIGVSIIVAILVAIVSCIGTFIIVMILGFFVEVCNFENIAPIVLLLGFVSGGGGVIYIIIEE